MWISAACEADDRIFRRGYRKFLNEAAILAARTTVSLSI
jgi:hypothetical protein